VRDQDSVGHVPTGPLLIRFDRKTQAFLGTILVLFALGTAFKIHGSSIGMWNVIWNRKDPGRISDAGVLLGTPKFIRSDEWGVATLMILSQARARPAFPVVNPQWGPAQVPLIFNLPVWHWSLLVRPQFWGFFFLDLERAYAFYWNMKACLLLGGVFLLLMLLTANDFWISLLGTGWVFFSGFTQWWYSTPAMFPEMVGCVALTLVAAHYLVLSPRRWAIGVAALVSMIFLLDSALFLYPPFQVPLIYFAIAILIGSLGPRLWAGSVRSHLALRAGCAALALAAVAGLILLYYYDGRQAIELMRGTVYPGKRMVTGGEVSLAQIFNGFYGFFMSEGSFPRTWQNVCEASNFVLLFPVPMAAVLWRVWRRRRVTALEWALILYLAVVFSWMAVGWPRPLAVASAFGLSPHTRSLHGLGLASIFLCCIFLARQRVDLPGTFPRRLLVAGSLLTLFVVISLDFDGVTKGFATPGQIALVSLGGAVAGYLLLARKRVAFALLILVPSIWSFALVNPIAAGLGPILDTKLFHEVSGIVEQDPNARWAVYTNSSPIVNYATDNLFKVAGAQVFNGTKVVPPFDDFRVLDPKSELMSSYNRYAHIVLAPGKDSELTLMNVHGDGYTLRIDPSNNIWRQLEIRYVALPFEATDPEFLGKTALVAALPDFGFWIYRYQWTFEPRDE